MDIEDNIVNETALWKGIKEGNSTSFELLYKLYFKTLYSYGRKINSHSSLVEDSIHDLFLDLWRYRESLSDTTSIKFYLFRSLRRRIIKNQEKDKEASVFEFHDDEIFIRKVLSHEASLIEGEQQNQQINRVKRHLTSLSPRHYESLVLRFYNEFSYKEISAMLEVNEQSARNIVQRALEQLRHFMKVSSPLILLFVQYFFKDQPLA